VTVQPDTANQGDFTTMTFRVPNEEDQAGTVKVEVDLPADHPIAAVDTKPVPGWEVQVTKAKLNNPIKTDDGTEVTEAVRTVTWTADPGVRIAPEQFQEFEVFAEGLPDDTNELVMPAIQTYDNGDVVRWDAPPAPPGAPEPEHPAPGLTLLPKGAKAVDAAAAGGADTSARWLGGIGLVLAALATGLGIGALLRGRRSGGPPT
jgi:uncharacterized protein YcnI